MRDPSRSRSFRLPVGRTAWAAGSLLLAGVAFAFPSKALDITPDFGSSITGNANAAQIEGPISSAIDTVEGLYSPNNVSVTVDFSYTPGAPGNLLTTHEEFYGYTYRAYTNALKADSAANPLNTSLAIAVANLSKGNDSDGTSRMAIAYAQALLLANYGLATPAFVIDASININSDQPFDFTHPVPSNQYDAIGGLEHELDEVLGGGGPGSTLNEILNNCTTNPTNFFCGRFGPTDLYRYSTPVSQALRRREPLPRICRSTAALQTSSTSIRIRAAITATLLRRVRGPVSSFRTRSTGPVRTRPTRLVRLSS